MKKMMRVLTVSLVIGSFGVTPLLADTVSTDITAFDGVASAPVAIEEQADVTGDGYLSVFTSLAKRLVVKIVSNGPRIKSFVCK